jgi:thiol-disulfide isomerase/thioredoxin
MFSAKFTAILKYILFIPFLLVSLYSLFLVKKIRSQKRRVATDAQVGKKFPFSYGIDTSGSSVPLDFAQSPITIIDFWFKNCPECIEEMMQFESAIKSAVQPANIISMSIDKFPLWKQAFDTSNKRLAFLSKSVPGWKHLMVPTDSILNLSGGQLVAQKLPVTGYPSYFVLNKNGNIIATPASAVAYLKANPEKQNEFYSFLTSKSTWKSFYLLLLLPILLLGYLFIFEKIKTAIIKKVRI